MALDFASTFGGGNNGNGRNRGGRTNNNEDRPAAQVWLNIGYPVEVANEETGKPEIVFISLPVGLALDQIEKVKTNSSNANYAAIQQAKNALLDQLLGVAGDLNPGEDRILEGSDLTIQIRRVRDQEAEAPVSQNQFVRQLNLG